jgi:CheY-like chemotaxis protein
MFSRRQVMQMKLCNLNQVVTDMLNMLRRLLGENIEVVFDGSSTPVMVNADVGMMEQVVMNLSVNARDAMPMGGRLTIAIRQVEISPESARENPEARPGSFVRLSVGDTGCGMDTATQQRIFEPFFTTKERGKGTGLGLASVHGIAKQHQGWIELESEFGRGSVFRMFLPLLPQTAPNDNPSVTEEIRGGHETILLVEDEPSVRNVAARTLKRCGYNVIEAFDGHEALRQWEKHNGQIDLLFSDVIMPAGMTGLELAERLKQNKADLKVIVSSGYSPDLAGKDNDFFLRNKGCFLQKPYAPRVLIDTVRRCLDGK